MAPGGNYVLSPPIKDRQYEVLVSIWEEISANGRKTRFSNWLKKWWVLLRIRLHTGNFTCNTMLEILWRNFFLNDFQCLLAPKISSFLSMISSRETDLLLSNFEFNSVLKYILIRNLKFYWAKVTESESKRSHWLEFHLAAWRISVTPFIV